MASTGELIMIPVGAGDLLDRITILEIKAERIGDEAKLLNVRRELGLLNAVRERQRLLGGRLDIFVGQLKAANEELWQIEEALRGYERKGEFGPAFVDLARSVYRVNDRRAACKRAIDELTGSLLQEEKSYPSY